MAPANAAFVGLITVNFLVKVGWLSISQKRRWAGVGDHHLEETCFLLVPLYPVLAAHSSACVKEDTSCLVIIDVTIHSLTV